MVPDLILTVCPLLLLLSLNLLFSVGLASCFSRKKEPSSLCNCISELDLDNEEEIFVSTQNIKWLSGKLVNLNLLTPTYPSRGSVLREGTPYHFFCFFYKVYKRGGVSFPFINIARGTTDPEIDSETWTKLGNNMAPLALIANLATRWGHLTFSHLITFSH